jgi:hypothetical protein
MEYCYLADMKSYLEETEGRCHRRIAVIIGNVGNEIAPDSRTSCCVTSVGGRRGSGQMLAKVIGAVQTASCIEPSRIKGL